MGMCWALASPDDTPFLQELFQLLIPEHCLGSILCHRNENGEYRASTVQNVVAQFEKLFKTVVTTCVGDLSSTVQDRALIFEHWILVAKVCLGPLRTLSEVCIPMSEWSSWTPVGMVPVPFLQGTP